MEVVIRILILAAVALNLMAADLERALKTHLDELAPTAGNPAQSTRDLTKAALLNLMTGGDPSRSAAWIERAYATQDMGPRQQNVWGIEVEHQSTPRSPTGTPSCSARRRSGRGTTPTGMSGRTASRPECGRTSRSGSGGTRSAPRPRCLHQHLPDAGQPDVDLMTTWCGRPDRSSTRGSSTRPKP